MKTMKDVKQYLSNEEAFKVLLDGGNVYTEGHRSIFQITGVGDLLRKDLKFYILVQKEVRTLEVNGEVFYPETEYPKYGENYYCFDGISDKGYGSMAWNNDEYDLKAFKRGIFKDVGEVERLVAAFEK